MGRIADGEISFWTELKASAKEALPPPTSGISSKKPRGDNGRFLHVRVAARRVSFVTEPRIRRTDEGRSEMSIPGIDREGKEPSRSITEKVAT